jgi:glycerophosphoryl diester phosphodiesterase
MKPLIVGHRGNARHAPENTRVSFMQAIEAGAAIVEMDTRLSRDGQIVLMHDDTVDRTTSGCGRVVDLTVQQLSQLDAGSWKAPKYRGEPVPTLTHVAEVCRGKAVMMLDLKCPGQGSALARWIDATNYPVDQLILAPWELGEGTELRRHLATCEMVLIGETRVDEATAWLSQLRRAGFTGVSVDHQVLTWSLVEAARALGMKVYTWTVNDVADLQRVCGMGVDGIITDDPAESARHIA